MEEKISVIIPVKNAEKTIKKCLDSVLNVDYPNFDVIVVDDGSTDNTPSILRGFGQGIRIIQARGVGPSAARNEAAKVSDAQYLAFTDSDCIVERSWLRELRFGFSDYSI